MKRSAPETSELLERARQGDAAALGQLLEAFRGHLRARAEQQLGERVATRVDASDVVQLTYLDAARNFGQFLGRSEPEWIAWLQRILDHNVAGIIRDHAKLQKRDVYREQALAVGPDDSQQGPGSQLDAGYSTPSQRAMRGEDADRLTLALAALPEDQREAVRLRHLEGKPLAEIAERLGKSKAAAAGLIKRGMQALRKQLHPGE